MKRRRFFAGILGIGTASVVAAQSIYPKDTVTMPNFEIKDRESPHSVTINALDAKSFRELVEANFSLTGTQNDKF